MIERFMMKLPFIGKMALESGAVLGDRQNCQNLLKAGESVLVFPEGVRGVSKSTHQFYHLQKFTRGFLRLALSTGTPIIPISVVGAEEFYPFVYQAKSLAKLLKLPALPISPFFPLLGPLGAIPLPSPVDIYVHDAYQLPTNVSAEAQDKILDEHIYKIQRVIQEGINKGLQNKRSYIDNSKRLALEFKEDILSKIQK
jgi:1-acyl-sn-glycerol-3-phosphate acyltransferase